MKTLEDLNKKWWYRFLKVIFGVSLLVVIAIINVIAFSGEIEKVDESKTFVQCNLGKKLSFSAQSMGLSLSSNDFTNSKFDYASYFRGYNDSNIKSILYHCYPLRGDDNDDIYASQKYSELNYKYKLIDVNLVGENLKSESQIKDTQLLRNDFENNYWQKTKNLNDKDKLNYLDFSFSMFDIKPVFSYSDFLKFFLMGNLIALCIFEALRRLFYYIALGKINP